MRAVADLIRALTWPAVIAAVLVLYRVNFGKLIDRIRSVKAGRVELAFGEKAIETDVLLTRAEVAAVNPEMGATGGALSDFDKMGISGSTLGGLVELAQQAPRAAVNEAWKLVQLCAHQAALAHGLPSEVPAEVASALARAGLTAADYSEAAGRLHSMWNWAQDPGVEIGSEAAQTYASSSFRLALALIQAANEPRRS